MDPSLRFRKIRKKTHIFCDIIKLKSIQTNLNVIHADEMSLCSFGYVQRQTFYFIWRKALRLKSE